MPKSLFNMSEKLCLQWHDFQENLNTAFGNLREDNEFADMTLACEDGQQIEAHKVILAASSPFFQNMLRRNKHPHPLIFMRGVKSEDLHAIVDFLYCGEANVFHENLASFLSIAEELKLSGLMGQTEDVDKKTQINYTDKTHQQMNLEPFHKKRDKAKVKSEEGQSNLKPKEDKQPPNVQMNIEPRVAITGDLQELDETVKSMMETSQSLVMIGGKRAKMCKVCGKEGQAVNIRDHIESNHLEGVSLPCNVCEKTFRSRMLLRKHKCT